MRLNRIAHILVIIVATAYSCIDPYTPDTSGYEEMLLIEGIISDDPSVPARVSISKSKPLSDNGYYELGFSATVMIICDDGSVYPFTEILSGKYENLNDPIVLEEGKYYKLQVSTSDNKIFESDYEPYIPGPPVESITFYPETKKISDYGFAEAGLQFYANTRGIDNEPIYLRWLLEATYNYSVPYTSDYIWNGLSMEEFRNSEFINCWKDVEIPGIYISDSYGLTENMISNAPLNFVSQHGDELTIKYSLMVTQLSISKASYKFWYDLNTLINKTGGFYETQPFRIRGNIECVSDSELEVSGVFEVASVTKKRVFAPRPTDFQIFNTLRCELDSVGTESFPWASLSSGSYLKHIGSGYFATSSSHCFICTQRGGTNIKPAFWE